MPKFVTVDEVEEGMLLAEPIRNNFGQVMMPVGHQIKAQHMRLLKIWNVNGIVIKMSNEEEENSALSPEEIKKIKEELETRMDWTCDFELEIDLFNTAIKHRGSKKSLKGDESGS